MLDRSGSMAGDKLDVAKQCARFVARRLQPDDLISVVAFDDQVDLVAPLAGVTTTTEAAIASLQPDGSTNLSGGWLKGLEELRRSSDGVRRVVLLTDGQANQGVTDPQQLVSVAEGTKADAATTTIGFGAGFDEDLLTAIADASGGATYFAETPDDAPGIFAEAFTGLTTLVAQNVSVEIRPAAEVELLAVLNEYPIVEVDGGLQAQVGDAYGGERRRLVFQLDVPQVAKLGPARVGDVVLRYLSVGESLVAHETTIPIVVNLVSADEAAAVELNREVVEETVLLHAARAPLRSSTKQRRSTRTSRPWMRSHTPRRSASTCATRAGDDTVAVRRDWIRALRDVIAGRPRSVLRCHSPHSSGRQRFHSEAAAIPR